MVMDIVGNDGSVIITCIKKQLIQSIRNLCISRFRTILLILLHDDLSMSFNFDLCLSD